MDCVVALDYAPATTTLPLSHFFPSLTRNVQSPEQSQANTDAPAPTILSSTVEDELPTKAQLPLPVTAPSHKLCADVSIAHARNLLSVLAAVCMFGANLAFSALHGDTEHTPSTKYIAWAFAAFAIGVVVTLVWQVALIADFHGESGRLYRSKPVIVAALAVGFSEATAGTLLLGLSMTCDELESVRTAGYTVISVILALVCGSLVRFVLTVLRRAACRPKTMKTRAQLTALVIGSPAPACSQLFNPNLSASAGETHPSPWSPPRKSDPCSTDERTHVDNANNGGLGHMRSFVMHGALLEGTNSEPPTFGELLRPQLFPAAPWEGTCDFKAHRLGN